MKTNFNPNRNIYNIKHSGKLELIHLISILRNKYVKSPDRYEMKACIDLSKTIPLFKPVKISHVLNFINSKILKKSTGKFALITSSPEQAALAMYIENTMNKKK